MSDREKRPYYPRKDLSGQIFGRWTVLGPAHRIGRKCLYNCRCECGTEREVDRDLLTEGRSRSCGCNAYGKEMRAKLAAANYKHGGRDSRLYYIWASMKARCANPKHQKFKDYGGRGITVCEEWKNSFENFQNWALANGYTENLTIDRINNDGNYEPGNCRWATAKEQRANQRPRKKKN